MIIQLVHSVSCEVILVLSLIRGNVLVQTGQRLNFTNTLDKIDASCSHSFAFRNFPFFIEVLFVGSDLPSSLILVANSQTVVNTDSRDIIIFESSKPLQGILIGDRDIWSLSFDPQI
jgi:hypothetical protein